MILASTLALAVTVQQDRGAFSHGGWYGQCRRVGYLGGEDREVCTAQMYDGASEVEGNIHFKRTAEKAIVRVFVPQSCVLSQQEASSEEGEKEPHLPASALAGPDRVARLKAFIQGQVSAAEQRCGRRYNFAEIRDRDLDKVLRATDGLRPGTFRLTDPAARAPLAAECGRQLEAGWGAGIERRPVPDGGQVQLMMYTLSEAGPGLAVKRFEAAREMMADYFAMGMGPGGSAIQGRQSAAVWQRAPSGWFVDLCDIAIEAWSGFVELGLYRDDRPGSQLFTVRSSTGVAQMSGYAIIQAPVMGMMR